MSTSETAAGAPAGGASAAENPNWRVTLWSMVGIQFVMSVAFNAMTPVFPLFLPQIGVTDRALVEFWAGVLTACGALVAAFASPLWGMVADRRGRKLMVMRSSLAVCIFTALMSLSQNVWELFALRALMGAFSGFSASSIAMVASQVPEWRLGAALGWLSTGQLTGSLIGPLLGGLASDLTGSYRIAFLLTSLLACTALVLTWLTVEEKIVTHGKRGKPSLMANFRVLTTATGVLPLLMVLLLAQFGTRSVQPVISLFVKDLVGARGDIATLAGFAFSMTGIADLVGSPFLGKRSDKLGYRRVLLICLAGAALATAPQSFAPSYWVFVAERFAVGLFIGGILPTANALIGRSVAASNRGLVYGMTASATFFGSFLGPFMGGTVASLFGIRTVFLVTASIMAMNWVWVFWALPKPEAASR